MKSLIFSFLFVAIILFNLNCATTSNVATQQPQQQQQQSVTSEDYEGKTVTIREIPSPPPLWYTKTSVLEKEYPDKECFVGYSKPVTSDQDANNNAIDDAKLRVNEFLGVMLKNVSTSIKKVKGVDVLDSADDGIKKAKSMANNLVKTAKPLESYIVEGKIYRGKGYWQAQYTRAVVYGFTRDAMKKAQQEVVQEQKDALKKQIENERDDEKKQLLKEASDELDKAMKESW